MAGARVEGAAHRLTRCHTVLLRIQKAQLFVPRNVNEQEQIVSRGQIEKPARRDVIDAQ